MFIFRYKMMSFLLYLSLINFDKIYSQNLFNSFFRTNSYNRYVKNPSPTRSLAPSTFNSVAWRETNSNQDYSTNYHHSPINSFNNDFRLPPLNYGSFPSTINGVDFTSASSTSSVSVSSNDRSIQRSSQQQQQQKSQHKFEERARNFDDITTSTGGNRYQNAYSDSPKIKNRQNSKKIFDNNFDNKENKIGDNFNNKNKGNKYNFDSSIYIDDNLDNALGQIVDAKDNDIHKPEVVYHHTSLKNRKHTHYHSSNHHQQQHLNDSNKYNQEKALNLKLEYGFKPLPSTVQSNSPTHPNVKIIQLNQNSINNNTSTESPVSSTSNWNTNTESQIDITPAITTTTLNSNISTEDAAEIISSLDEIYPMFEQDNEKHQLSETDFEPEAESSGHNNIYSHPKQSNSVSQERKSKILDQENTSTQYYSSGDFQKLVHSPMEGEQSDLHRLAFAGIESFKPDPESPIRSSLDTIIGAHFLNFNSLSNYPDITNFKSMGLDCAKKGKFCEYDSTYPKDYIDSKIRNCSEILDAMYTEIPEGYSDYEGYREFIQIHEIKKNSLTKNITICDNERRYIRPSVIQDINGYYNLILQSSYYFQQIPIETCIGESKQCNLPACRSNKTFNASRTRCIQKYRTQPLISIEHHPPGSKQSYTACPKIRLFRLPSNCVCELF